MIICEKCQKQMIGEYDFSDEKKVKKTFYENSFICPHCGAEFCLICADKMEYCYCCGKPLVKGEKQ